MNDYSNTPRGRVLQGSEAAAHRYQWYEQIIADGLEHLVATAHIIAKYDFRIGYEKLAECLKIDRSSAIRRVQTLVDRGHLHKVLGNGKRGIFAVNRYEMIITPGGTGATSDRDEGVVPAPLGGSHQCDPAPGGTSATRFSQSQESPMSPPDTPVRRQARDGDPSAALRDPSAGQVQNDRNPDPQNPNPVPNRAAPYENPFELREPSPAPFPVGPSPGEASGGPQPEISEDLADQERWLDDMAGYGRKGQAAGKPVHRVRLICCCRQVLRDGAIWQTCDGAPELQDSIRSDISSLVCPSCHDCGTICMVTTPMQAEPVPIPTEALPTEPQSGRGDVSQGSPPPHRADTQTLPAASVEPQQPQRPPLDGAFTRRWIAERVEWAAREWSKPDKGGRHFVGLEVTCSEDDGGCGLSIAPEARWVDLSWYDEQGAKDEYDTLRRLPCPHCGEIGTAVMEYRLIPDVASAPALQPISTSEASGAQDDAAEDTEDAEAW